MTATKIGHLIISLLLIIFDAAIIYCLTDVDWSSTVQFLIAIFFIAIVISTPISIHEAMKSWDDEN